MEIKDIYELMEKFDASSAGYLEIKMGDDTVKLKKQSYVNQVQSMSAPAPVFEIQEPERFSETQTVSQIKQDEMNQADYIKAPLVGVFYEAASPEQEPIVQVGSHVKKGDKVCLIEAMKMMSEVKADKDGIIKKILVNNGDTVEYDQPLFQIQE